MNKKVDAVGVIGSASQVGTGKGNTRELTEPRSDIHGVVQVTVGRWHDDKNGALLVNGRQGYYTYSEEQIIDNLLTLDGRDLFHAQDYTNTTAGTRGAGFIAVSANVAAPVAGDTILVGEITTGGLARADADTKTHTNDTNVSTIAHTFTASATHTAVHKSGMFNASSGITLTHAAVFTSDVTLAINDTLTVTWTLTLG